MKETNNIPEGYKNSSLGIIPKDWEVKRLGDISKYIQTNTFSREKLNYEKGQIYNIHYGDILTKFNSILDISKTNLPYINEAVMQEYTITHYVLEGDVIIADTAEDNMVGKACEISNVHNKKIVSGLHTILIRFNKELFTSKFLGYYINSTCYHKKLIPYIQGIKVSSISKTVISNSNIIIPPLNEQIEIVNILSIWDSTIEKQSKLIEKLELRKRGLMQQLLTGKKRISGFDGVWKECKLSALFTERNETNREELPLLSITNNKGVILQSESDKRDISNNDKSKYKRICPNDIGYNTMRMWQGRSALSSLEGIVSPAYTIITPRDIIDVNFMILMIKQPKTVYKFWCHSQGLVSDTLNCKFKDFSQVKVIMPPKNEQTIIANYLELFNKEILLAERIKVAYEEQKKGLMELLLTGKRLLN